MKTVSEAQELVVMLKQHSDRSLESVAEVLSLAQDGLHVLMLDSARYQERIQALEADLKKEVAAREHRTQGGIVSSLIS